MAGNRADIQGLRALAVVAVVLEHLTGHPRGGFVGVDVFFVISGFLITNQLLHDLDRRSDTGTDATARRRLIVFLGDFYRRRIRRLLPAAVTVVVAAVIVSHYVFTPGRVTQILLDGKWALLFTSNWRFADIGTDYFTADEAPSPLQHYWSLSVEEQFYVVWPLAMFAVALLVGHRVGRRGDVGRGARHRATSDRTPHNRRLAVVAVASLISALSLWYAFAASAGSPTSAYFSTFARAWELGIGAILAAAAPTLRMSSRLAAVLSLSGVALIVVAYFTTRGGTGFPAPGAVLPCVGAAVVLAAHDGRRTTPNPLLVNRPAVFLGDLSYSLYLVHFPVIILLGQSVTSRGIAYYATALLLTLALAMLLYLLVERPVLRSRWLLPAHERVRGVGERRRQRRGAVVPALAASVVLCVAAVAAYAAIPSDADREAQEYRRIQQAVNAPTDGARVATPSAASSPHGRSPSTPGPPATPRTSKIVDQLDDALRATRYPSDLDPSMADVISGPQARLPFVQCSRIELGSVQGCTWGKPTARHLIYLAGDSTAMVWAEALAHIVERTPGWRLRVAASYGCHFASVVYRNPLSVIQDGCADHTSEVSAEIAAMKPDVLIVGAALHPYQPVGEARDATAAEYAGQQRKPMQRALTAAKRVVFLEPPPGGRDPADCYRKDSSPVSCVYRPKKTWLRFRSAMRAAITAAGMTYVESAQWFCGRSGYCPPFAAGTPVMHDQTHAAPGWMDVIWPGLREDLRRRAILPP